MNSASVPAPDGDRLLSASETANALGVSTFWLDRDRKRPEGQRLIPFIRLSRTRGVRYKLADIQTFVTSRRQV